MPLTGVHKWSSERKKKKKGFINPSRRAFLKIMGSAAVGAGISELFSQCIWLNDAVAALLACEGYLLVDTKKCQGCMSCMLACSLVHEGKIGLSQARIQVIQSSFEKFPDDLTIAQCRQCEDPECVKACPSGALHVDRQNGNVRKIDVKKCIGCKACIRACPFVPSRALWSHEDSHALKCDLCVDSPFWNYKGGPEGRQACVEICPLKAIQFTRKMPEQKGDTGYQINLRGEDWRKLGYPTD